MASAPASSQERCCASAAPAAPAPVSEQLRQTVAELRAQLRSEQPPPPACSPAQPCVCVGGKRLPGDGSVLLAELDIDLAAGARYCHGEELLACSEAELRQKTPPKLGLGRYLTLWILLAVGVGIGIGQIPGTDDALHAMKVGNTNMLTAIGMIVMLLPPFAAVQYGKLWSSVRAIPKRIAVGSLVVNWAVGPFLMLFIGIATLGDHPDLLQGVMYIGAARCIAMVLVWTAIAGGDQFLCVSLVLLNSVITVVTYAPVVTLLGVVARALGVEVRGDVSFLTVLFNVLVYLGIPLALGVSMWAVGRRYPGYRTKFLPRFAPAGLLALLWTVVVMFAEMSKPLLGGSVSIGNIFWVCVPLLAYFVLMFFSSWALCRWVLRGGAGQTITFAFTAASNNFELALAACTAIFGTSSNQAVATVLGPLIEIPVMLALVHVAKYLAWEEPEGKDGAADAEGGDACEVAPADSMA